MAQNERFTYPDFSIMPASNPNSTPSNLWTPGRVVAATLTVAAVSGAFWVLYRFDYAVFMLLAAMMLRVAIKSPVERLRARGLSANASVTLVFGSLLLLFIGLGFLVAPILIDQGTGIAFKLPVYYADFRSSLAHSTAASLRQIGSSMPYELSALFQGGQSLTADSSATINGLGSLTGALADIGHNLFLIIATLMLTIYWTLDAERVTRALLLRVPHDKREGWRELIGDLETKVGRYFHGQLILCAFIFVLSTAVFLVIGLPYALVLGLLAGLFEALPMIGPLLGMIPALIIALSLSPQHAVWVVIAAVVIQQVENNLLVPRVMDKSVGINPILSILAITAFSLLFGLLGALLAIPVAAMLQILVERLIVLRSEVVVDTVDSSAPVAGSRDKIGAFRLAASELAEDVRKQARAKSHAGDSATLNSAESGHAAQEIEDQIEQMAMDLAALLVTPAVMTDESASKSISPHALDTRAAKAGAAA